MKILKYTLLVLASITLFSCDDDSNVIGLNSATKYGSITVTATGTRQDGDAFKVTKVFRYTPEEGLYYSSYFEDGVNYFDFNIERMHGAVSQSHNDNFAAIDFVLDEDVPAQLYMQMSSSVVFSDEYAMYLSFNSTLNTDDITSHSFSEDSGKLKIKFKSVIPGASNSTGNDLTITTEVNVTVFKGLNGPIGD